MEEAETMEQTDVETRPLDVVALAAQLGITFPQLAAAAATSTTTSGDSSVDSSYSQSLPIATLASHLLAASQNLAGQQPFTSAGDAQTTLTMATLASQLLPTTTATAGAAATATSLVSSLIAPGLQMLNGQLPVLNELCNTEQQQLDSSEHGSLLSMSSYDQQLHPTLLKTEPME